MAKFFEERERAAELLFVRAEEARFIARCRGIRALAAYTAGKLGVDDHSAEAYAQELLGASVNGMSDQALLERVRADLEANRVIVNVTELRAELTRSTAQAVYDVGPAASTRM